jgi:cation diffusion facilitator family transporter
MLRWGDIVQSMQHEKEEQHQVARGAWSSLIVNAVLTVGKGAVGLSTGSRALLADAVHSAADLVGSLAVMIGLKVARKPPDEDHPYGHGKAELISSGVVAGLLVAAAIDVGYNAIRSLWQPVPDPSWVSALAAFVAILVKEWMYRYNYRLGKRLNSKSLMASALDHRSDVFSSIAALIGIGLSLLGKAMGVDWLLHMDGVAGAVVAVLVLRIGYEISRESVQLLMDRVILDGEYIAAYERVIHSVAGVQQMDALRIRDHGRYLMADVKISVDANITVADGHQIAVGVKHALMVDFPRLQDVLVHVNPYNPEEM